MKDMKNTKSIKRLTLAAIAAILFIAPASYAEQSGEHSMMTGAAAGADTRTELRLPDAMKIMQKAMMRKHLDTLSEITAALAANDLDKASTIAREKLGWNPEEEQRCERVSMITGEADFVTLGKAVHAKADELAGAARAGDRDKALVHLSALIKNCNACHQRFRH